MSSPSSIEVECFEAGIVSELVVPVGTKVAVGGLLARIGDGDAPTPTAAPPAAAPVPMPPAAPPRSVVAPPPVMPQAALASGGIRAKVTPAARRRAVELSLDAGSLAGTGIDGSVTLADVEAAVAQHPAVVPQPRSVPRRSGFDLAEMRKAIATAMSRSKREIPHYYLSHTVNLGVALEWLETFNASQPVAQRLLPAVLLLKAAALGLREVPQLSGTYVDGGFHPGDGIHPGWAISLRGGGLVAPAIRDAGALALPQLMVAMRDLVQRARTGGLRSSELSSPTVTVTSLGERAAESVTGIIYPPQVAIIGFGTISPRPWVQDGQVVARPLVTVSLAADHRVTDGHVGARLLTAIERLLQEPAAL